MEQDNKLIRSLVENAKKGNNSAFNQLYHLNSGRVYALCLRILSDRDLADKITVKIFLTALNQIKFFRGDSLFAQWLIGISVYTLLEELREEKSERNEKVNKIPYKYKVNIILEEAIIELPKEERIAFILHDIEKYSDEEVADLLKIDLLKAKKYISDARSILINKVER